MLRLPSCTHIHAQVKSATFIPPYRGFDRKVSSYMHSEDAWVNGKSPETYTSPYSPNAWNSS